MDKQRIRFLLRATRPNGADAGDATFCEALSAMRRDPELSAWYEREQAIDRAIAAKLRELHAPAELRQLIASGAAVSARRRWRRPFATIVAALAAAASIALLIHVAWPRRPVSSFESIVAAAIDTAKQPIALNFYSTSAAELKTWLEKQSLPVPGEIPPSLAALETIGGKSITWHGVPASEVAFRAPGFYRDADGAAVDAVLHLFTVDQHSCSGGVTQREPIVYSRQDQAVATWGDSSRFYVLVVQAPEDALRRFLHPDLPAVALLGPNENRLALLGLAVTRPPISGV